MLVFPAVVDRSSAKPNASILLLNSYLCVCWNYIVAMFDRTSYFHGEMSNLNIGYEYMMLALLHILVYNAGLHCMASYAINVNASSLLKLPK